MMACPAQGVRWNSVYYVKYSILMLNALMYIFQMKQILKVGYL